MIDDGNEALTSLRWLWNQTKTKTNSPVYVPTRGEYTKHQWYSSSFQRSIQCEGEPTMVSIVTVVIWTVPVKGSLASPGVRVSTTAVYQNGSWVPGITYKGYYILAAGKQYPFCTVIDLYNHTISGNGISPSQPIRGIVLDRGGAVSGNHFDVFIGSQKSSGVRHVGGSPKASCRIRQAAVTNWNTKDHLPAINGTKVFF